jgi:hypothetical protein
VRNGAVGGVEERKRRKKLMEQFQELAEFIMAKMIF